MRAIVPLNVVGLRVSNADDSGITSNFAGRTAMFDKLPHTSAASRPAPATRSGAPSTSRPRSRSARHPPALGATGVFKRGVQDPDTG